MNEFCSDLSVQPVTCGRRSLCVTLYSSPSHPPCEVYCLRGETILEEMMRGYKNNLYEVFIKSVCPGGSRKNLQGRRAGT